MENNISAKISYLIRDVNLLMKESVKNVFEETGLTAPQIMVMSALSKHGKSMKISELSEKMKLSNSTISGIIDRLEKQNYVERVRSKEDRRVVRVSIVKDCRDIMHTAFHKKIEETIEQKLMTVEPKEIETILNGLEILKKLLES